MKRTPIRPGLFGFFTKEGVHQYLALTRGKRKGRAEANLDLRTGLYIVTERA